MMKKDKRPRDVKEALPHPFISAEEQRIGFAKAVEEMGAIGYREDEEDLSEILKREKIWSKWAFMIQLLSEQALERFGTVDISDEQMTALFLEGLKQYRSTVNVDYLRKP